MIAAELRGDSKPSLNEALGWIGSRVDDIYGANVGGLEDVWIDPGTGAPRWLLVKEGRFGGRTTLIPFEDATAGAGHVWVPYERDVVRAAPEIEPGAPLTHQVEAALRSHYAASVPPAISREPTEPPAERPPDYGAGMGTATIRLQGPDAQAPPAAASPARGPDPEPAGYELPPRPAPPIAAPPSQPPPAGPQPPAEPYRPAPQAPQTAAPQAHQYQVPPEQPPLQYQPPPAQPYPQPYPSAQAPPPAQPAAPPAAPDPIAALNALAASPGVHYVEIELAGELSIRGELRSIRVVPRA